MKIIYSYNKKTAINADNVKSFFIKYGQYHILGGDSVGVYCVFADEKPLSRHSSEKNARKELDNIVAVLTDDCRLGSVLYVSENSGKTADRVGDLHV